MSAFLGTICKHSLPLLGGLTLLILTARSDTLAQGICYRTKQVQDALLSEIDDVSACEDVTGEHLAGVTELDLSDTGMIRIKTNDFDGLSDLRVLWLHDNPLRNLRQGLFLQYFPIGVFDDVLDTLEDLRVDPHLKAELSFESTVRNTIQGQTVRVRVYLSRPLPVAVRVPFAVGGTAATDDYYGLSPDPDGGLLFRAGSTYQDITFGLSEETRNLGKNIALTLGGSSQIGLRRSDAAGPDAPRLKTDTLLDRPAGGAIHTVTVAYRNQLADICDRTPQIRDSLLLNISKVSACHEVTAAHLASLEALNLRPVVRTAISELRADDFSGLSSVRNLLLQDNALTSLPDGIFHDLKALEELQLGRNSLSTLPESVFHGLGALRKLSLDSNPLNKLPEGIFRGLNNLQDLDLRRIPLSDLPEGVFRGLRSLQRLLLTASPLGSLPEGIFSGLESLKELDLSSINLSTLPERVFLGLGSLRDLSLSTNILSELPARVFHGLVSLEWLTLDYNNLISLPEGLFNGLANLQYLYLHGNSLRTLSAGIFRDLHNLTEVNLEQNSLTELPKGVFDDVLDTLGIDGFSTGLFVDPHLRAELTFDSTKQNAIEGSIVRATVTLSRTLPLAVRVPFRVSGTLTRDDYRVLSPHPDSGLLFLAGETTKEIAFGLLDDKNSHPDRVLLSLEIRVRRSDGTGEDAPYASGALANLADGGALQTITVVDFDPSKFTPADLVRKQLTLNGTRSDGTPEDIALTFRQRNKLESTTRTGEATSTIRFGSYSYQATARQQGSLILSYDDGTSCEIGLTFTSTGTGSSNYRCSDGNSGGGSFRLTVGAPFVPVILKAGGRNNSFFTSELTLTNRGSVDTRLDFTYTPHIGAGSGTASEFLTSSSQKIVPDALDYLSGLGIPIPDSGKRIGTLRVDLPISADVGVMVRTTTAVPDGRAGLAYPGVPDYAGVQEAVYLCGLRQNSQDRSNVAFQNMGSAVEGPITLRTTVFSGDRAAPGSRVLDDVTLEPGEFHQYSRVLGSVANGYVKVERIEGIGSFYAYGVINDQANSDGSFVFPVTASSLAGIIGQTLPVIVETGVLSSKLTVTNFSQAAKTVNFSFVAAGIQTADRTARFSLALAAGEQRILPDIVDELRRQGVEGIGPAGRLFAGAVFATVEGGDMSGIVIGAQTGSAGGGGQYSVFYNAVPYGAAFGDSAWIDALQQNEENRSNLALVNTGEVDGSESLFNLDIYDGDTGELVNTVTGIRVPARGWNQINAILANFAPGTTQGYVQVRKISGNNPFLAYGVINDGGSPGLRSGDGAYVPARE